MQNGVLSSADLERDAKAVGIDDRRIGKGARDPDGRQKAQTRKADAAKAERADGPMKWSDFSARLSSALSASSDAGTLSEDLRELGADLGPEHFELILAHWPLWARPDQLPPAAGDEAEAWRVWLILGGRGAGKTRAGAEWVRAQGARPRARRRAGGACASRSSARRIADVRERDDRGRLGPARRASRRASGRTSSPRSGSWSGRTARSAQVFSAEDPDSLRGPQFDAAWCDELAKWRHAGATWDMLQFALRLGRASAAGGDDDAAADRRC